MIDIEKKTKIKLFIKLLIYIKETVNYSKNRKAYTKNIKAQQENTRNSYVEKLLSTEEKSSKAFDRYFMEKIFNQLCHEGEASNDCSEYYKIFNIINESKDNTNDIYKIIQTIIDEVNEFHEINTTSIKFKNFRYKIYKYAKDLGLHKNSYNQNDINKLSKFIKDEFSKIFDRAAPTEDIKSISEELTNAKSDHQTAQNKVAEKKESIVSINTELQKINEEKKAAMKKINNPDLSQQREGRETLKKLEEKEKDLLQKLVGQEEELKKAEDEEIKTSENLEKLQQKLEKAKKKQKDDQDTIEAERNIDIARKRAEAAANRAEGKNAEQKPLKRKRDPKEHEFNIQEVVESYDMSEYSHDKFNEFIKKLYTLEPSKDFQVTRLRTTHNRKNELNNIALILINKYLTSTNREEKTKINNILISLKSKYEEIYKSIK